MDIPNPTGNNYTRFNDKQRRRIAEESMQPGARVRDIAMKYEISRAIVYNWRQMFCATSKSSSCPAGESRIRNMELARLTEENQELREKVSEMEQAAFHHDVAVNSIRVLASMMLKSLPQADRAS